MPVPSGGDDSRAHERYVRYTSVMDDRLTPLTAPSADDPYPYYDRLAVVRPFAFDTRVPAWIAASPAAVREALVHPALAVRPAAEPVPAAMLGTPLGEVFKRLARMNEGPRHDELRAHVETSIARWSVEAVESTARRCADALAADVARGGLEMDEFLYDVPASAIAALIGLEPTADTIEIVRDFARSIAAPADREAAARGAAAAHVLSKALGTDVHDDESANRLGFLFQSHDPVAGLIGAAVSRLSDDPRLRATIERDPAACDALLARIACEDPPVHNTRRYAVGDARIGGSDVITGDVVLILIASAARQPAGDGLEFGHGVHTCPGSSVAFAIARAGVASLVEARVDLLEWRRFGYRPLPNARVPQFRRTPAA